MKRTIIELQDVWKTYKMEETEVNALRESLLNSMREIFLNSLILRH